MLSPFLPTNTPSCSFHPLFPVSPPSPISYPCVSILLWLCPSPASPLCPCDSHGPAVPSAPSHFLLLPLPACPCRGKPCRAFSHCSEPCPSSDVSAPCHAQGMWKSPWDPSPGVCCSSGCPCVSRDASWKHVGTLESLCQSLLGSHILTAPLWLFLATKGASW